MAVARQIFKGTTYLVTRRCTQRKLLAVPKEEVNEILLFCLIWAADLYGMKIHAYAFLANHYHLVLTDPPGRLPLFQGWLNRFSAKCLNAFHGRWENLWASGTYSAVRLREEVPGFEGRADSGGGAPGADGSAGPGTGGGAPDSAEAGSADDALPGMAGGAADSTVIDSNGSAAHGACPDTTGGLADDALPAVGSGTPYGTAEGLRAETANCAPVDPACEDILDKMVYTLTNPVEAGLVDRGYRWPGVWSPPALMAEGYVEARRPSFFREDNGMPEKVRMKLSLPPGFDHLTPRQFSNLVAKKVREKEDQIQQAFKAQGRSFMGVKKILAQKSDSKPKTQEPRRKLNPRVACGDKWKRIEILQRLKDFLKEYAVALARYRAGEKDVLFPPGTYKMRVLFNVKYRPRLQAEPVPV